MTFVRGDTQTAGVEVTTVNGAKGILAQRDIPTDIRDIQHLVPDVDVSEVCPAPSMMTRLLHHQMLMSNVKKTF